MSKKGEGVYLAFALVGAVVLCFGIWRIRRDAAGDSAWLRHEVAGGERFYY